MEDCALPAVSVIMPVFNRAAVVRRAIDSVLAQEFTDFELIVVDDGSTDGTQDVVAAIGDLRLRFIPLASNGGGNAARNLGIREARAPIIAFLDSDDYYLPHKLATVVRILGERPEIGVVLDSYLKVHASAANRPDTPRINPVLDTNGDVLAALYERRIWKATPGITVRRDAALAAGLFDEGLRRRQDYDFIIHLAGVARCASIDEVLWMKTYADDAISSNPDTSLGSIIAFYNRHPGLHSDPLFRGGVGLDLARHFKQIIGHRGLRSVPANAWPLIRLFGLAGTIGILTKGFRSLRARKRRARA